MRFHEFGDNHNPHIILIHGGGIRGGIIWEARLLSDKYHVILPVLDGHGEEFQKEYVSTEQSAQEILEYIKDQCDGHVFAFRRSLSWWTNCHELLSLDSRIADKAIIDGSLCIPQPKLTKMSIAFVKCLGSWCLVVTCKMQLETHEKVYPKMAHPEELKIIIWKICQDCPSKH